MDTKKLNYFSGIILSIFISLHLFNHFYSVFGILHHIHLMNALRMVYRNAFIESILLLAVFVQIISGFRLLKKRKKINLSGFKKLQIWTGIYLSIFLIIHLLAVFVGRYYLHLDTNIYFGVAGLNVFPFNLFFIPYYSLAIISVFGHVASIHQSKAERSFIGLNPNRQAIIIVCFGIIFTGVILFGLTNHFHGLKIPKEYNVLIMK
ncbi:hypothetical protein DF947_08470 [Pedobacter paludis]|uniref:DUF4405 domain-containing protein n=1 Tax=Pedobacter paludis TaxID=2203212 RepID=A0A317EZC3_9SPHI|nr:hypothetical protein DF947_08470 [Pedobacter paludis]